MWKKILPCVYKDTQGMQHLDYPPLHKNVLPTQNHQQNNEWSQSFNQRQHKNVPVTIGNSYNYVQYSFVFPLTLSQTSPGFYISAVQVFWKHNGKRKIARNEQFLLFPQCFLSVWRTFPPFSSNIKLPSANYFSLEESKICRLGRG